MQGVDEIAHAAVAGGIRFSCWLHFSSSAMISEAYPSVTYSSCRERRDEEHHPAENSPDSAELDENQRMGKAKAGSLRFARVAE